MAMTARNIDRLKPGQRVTDKSVTGLHARRTASATTFYLQYRSPIERDEKGHGLNRNRRIGLYPALSIDDAKRMALALRLRIDAGEDPHFDARTNTEMHTLRDLCDWFLRRKRKELREKTTNEYERIINVNVLPIFGDVEIKAITEMMMLRIVDQLEERDKAVMADRTFKLLKLLFKTAREARVIDINPIADLTRRSVKSVRDRFLTAREVALFWNGMDDAAITEQMRLALRLLLVTGQRLNEVLCAERGEFDFEAKTWTIPAERAKNKRKHTLPLNALAIELVEQALAIADRSIVDSGRKTELILPSRRRGAGTDAQYWKPIDSAAPARAMKRNANALGFDKNTATPHDLRRTMVTQLMESGARADIVEHLVNHVSGTRGGVAGVYNRSSPIELMRVETERWQRLLTSYIDAEEKNNVVQMR